MSRDRKAYNASHKAKIAATQSAYYAAHKSEAAAYRKTYYATHKLELASRQLKRKYGLTTEDYAVMLNTQGGVCILCGRPPNGKALAVDHDHITKKVRGLLCVGCNQSLGHFEKHKNEYEAYLERYK